MSITRVQGNSVASSGTVTSQIITLPSGVAQGNLLVVVIETGINPSVPTISPPDASWTQAVRNLPVTTTADIQVAIWYMIVDGSHAGQTSWTWTVSASHSTLICIEEWNASQGWPSNPLDTTAVGNVASPSVTATTITSGTTATTTQGEEVWIAGLGYAGTHQTEGSITAGWTKDLEAVKSAGTNYTATMLYLVKSATGAAQCSYVIGSAAQWAGAVAAFKDNAGAFLTAECDGVGTLSANLTTNTIALSVECDGLSTLSAVFTPPPPIPRVLVGNTPQFVIAGTLTSSTAIGRLSAASFHVLTDTSVHFQQFQQVQIYDQNQYLAFSGYVSDPNDEYQPGFQQQLVHEIACIDQHYLADKRVIAKLYRNQTCGAIANDIVTTYLAAEGVTVGQIATGATVPIANFGYVKVSDALDALVTYASASGTPHFWMIDQFKMLWFLPYTALTGPSIDGTQIDDGQASGVVPTVNRTNPKYRNTQYATGGVAQTGTNDETRTGDGQSRSFTYSYALAQAPSLFTLNGVAKTLGTKGQTGYQYYWAPGDPTIAQDSGQTVLVSTDRLRMVYIGQYSAVFSASQSAALIAAQAAIDGTSGINEEVLEDTTIATAVDGTAKSQQQLTQYGQSGQRFVFATLQSGYAAGQLVRVSYPPLGLGVAGYGLSIYGQGLYGDTLLGSYVSMLIEDVSFSDQHDGINYWYTLTGVIGPYDTTWVQFFGNLFKKPPKTLGTVSLGVTVLAPLFPSPSLLPSPTLFPS